jgi:hypothetical protein
MESFIPGEAIITVKWDLLKALNARTNNKIT